MKYWYRMQGKPRNLYATTGICLTRNAEGLEHYFDWTGSESAFISSNLISHLNVINIHEFNWGSFKKSLVFCPDNVAEWAEDFRKAIASGNIDSITYEWLMMTDKKKIPINTALNQIGVEGLLCPENNNSDFPAVYIPDGSRVKIIKTLPCLQKGDIPALIAKLEGQ